MIVFRVSPFTLICLAIFLTHGASVSAQSYTIRNLGTQLGHNLSYGRAINDKGVVVGHTQSSQTNEARGFLISPPYNNMINLETWDGNLQTYMNDISNNNVAVGHCFISFDATMVLWAGGALTTVPHLSGESDSFLSDINDQGVMVGSSGSKGLIIASGTLTPINPLPNYTIAACSAINATGVVVGISVDASNNFRATKWMSGVPSAVPDLGGGESRAFDIADNGLIVGQSLIPDQTETHAFMTPLIGGAVDLGTLGGLISVAYGTNGEVVVGTSSTAPPNSIGAAFVYSEGMMKNLNELIPENSGWVLNIAQDVNANGQICGTGIFNGETRAFLLTPNPPTGGAADWDFTMSDNAWTAAANIPPFEPAESNWVPGIGYGLRATGFPCFAFLQSPEVTLRTGRTYRLYVTIATTATTPEAAPQIRLRAFQTTTNMSEFLALDSVGSALPSLGDKTYQFTISPQIAGPAQTFRFALDYTYFNPEDEQSAWVYLQRLILAEE